MTIKLHQPSMRIYMKAGGPSKETWTPFAIYERETRTLLDGHLLRYPDGWSVEEAERVNDRVVQVRHRTDKEYGSVTGGVEGALVVGECRRGFLTLWKNRLWCVQQHVCEVFNPKTGKYNLPPKQWLSTPAGK